MGKDELGADFFFASLVVFSTSRVRFSRLPRIKQVLGSEEDHLTE